MLLLEYWPNKKVVTPCCLPACNISCILWVAGEFQQCCMNSRLRLELQVSQHKSQRCCFICIFYKDEVNFGRIWVQSFFEYTFDFKKKKKSWHLNLLLFLFLTSFLPPAQRMGRTMQVPCDTEYPAFVSERTIKENTGNLDCDGCIKYETHTCESIRSVKV